MSGLESRIERLENDADAGPGWLLVATVAGDGLYTMLKRDGTAHTLTAGELQQIAQDAGPVVVLGQPGEKIFHAVMPEW